MNGWRLAVFLVISLVVPAGMVGYLGTRLVGPLRLVGPWRNAVWTLLVLAHAMIPLAFSLRWVRRGAAVQAVTELGFTCAAFLFLLLVLLLARDAGWHVLRVANALPVDGATQTRWLAQSGAVVLAGAMAFTALGFWTVKEGPRVERVPVTIQDLPKELEGYRLVQLSDIHVGLGVDGDYLANVVRVVNTLDADAVAITGDLVDRSVAEIAPDVALLTGLRSRDGTFFVTGNHEYYAGVNDWVDALRGMGLQVLINEHVLLKRGAATLVLAGVTDFTRGRHARDDLPVDGVAGVESDPAAAVAGAPPDAPKVLLAHQPGSAPAAREAGFDVMLCGHTHGGQFFPWSVMVRAVYRQVAGLYDVDGMQLYVHRGTGYWGPPVRLGVPAEIAVLELHAAR